MSMISVVILFLNYLRENNDVNNLKLVYLIEFHFYSKLFTLSLFVRC